MPTIRLKWRVFLVLTVYFGLIEAAFSLAQSRDDLFTSGIKSLQAGETLNARAVFAGIIERWPGDADAHYYLAQTMLDGPDADPKAAKAILKKALRRDAENLSYQALDLWRGLRDGGGVFPWLQRTIQARKAERLLREDSTLRFANLVRGAVAFDDYRNAFRKIEFGNLSRMRTSIAGDTDLVESLAILLEPDLVGPLESKSIEFHEREHAGFQISYTEGTESEAYHDTAWSHLQRAIESQPEQRAACQYLMRMAVLDGNYAGALPCAREYQRYHPDEPDGWLFAGLSEYRLGKFSESAENFSRGIERLDSDDRVVFEHYRRERSIGKKKDGDDHPVGSEASYWALQDPRMMTPENERLLEHYARLVYADLRFGELFGGRRGWRTEPGDVIVRRGMPLAEARYGTMADAFLLFHYGNEYYYFMDLSKANRFTYYSPSATAFQGPRNVAREWKADFAITARERYRETPFVSQFTVGNRISTAILPTLFRSRDTVLVVVPFSLSPLEVSPTGAEGWTIGLFSQSLMNGRRTGESVVATDNAWTRSSRKGFQASTTVMQLRIPSSPQRMSLELESSDLSTVAYDHFNVDPESLAPVFAMSGIMPASLVEENDLNAPFTRGNLGIYPLSQPEVEYGTPLYLYFEVYGLATSDNGASRYRIEAALAEEGKKRGLDRIIASLFGNDRRDDTTVSVRFDEEADTSTVSRYVILDTDRARIGLHIVVVRVTDLETGAHVETMRKIELK